MCDHLSDASLFAAASSSAGSRRRRLWDLPANSHCSIVGVCISIGDLRRLLDRLYDGESEVDDYDLHVRVVHQCATRSRATESLNKVFDQRFALALRTATKAKTTEALGDQWGAAVEAGDIAGALWATLTHPRCDAALEDFVLREVHMIQHQAGAAVRAETSAMQALAHENATLARELGRVQSRSTRLQAERTAEHDALQAQLGRLRVDALAREATITKQVAQLAALREDASRTTVPASRDAMARHIDALKERIRALEQELIDARAAQVKPPTPEPIVAATPAAEGADAPPLPDLDRRAVLCVGGLHRHIPIYRELVERNGGRFAHHDGGVEDSTHRLDAILAAADLVICQAGCISHNAYWLVKDHCKRTGKRCVYLDKPSIANFTRGLARMAAPQTVDA